MCHWTTVVRLATMPDMIALIAHDQKKRTLVEFVRGHIEAVIFFRDPLTAQPHEPDVSALMRVCDVHDVPLATNRATAEAVVRTLALASRTKRQPPKARRKSSS